MKKKFKYCSSIIALGTLMFFSSCSNSTNYQKEGVRTIKTDSLPKNPKDGQVYRDNNGHSWIYDYAMMRWMFGGSGGSGNTYYYYPSSGTYQDNTGRTVNPPASVSSGISDGIKARSQTVTKTIPSSTSTTKSSSVTTNSKSTSKSHSVFGSTGKGHSISS